MKHEGVYFSDAPIWVSLLLAFLISISETIFGETLRNSNSLKHLPLILFIPSFAIFILGNKFNNRRQPNLNEVIRTLWPFILLGLYATIGSVYAKSVLEIQENFLVLGIYLLLMPAFYKIGYSSNVLFRVIRPLKFIWSSVVFISILGAIYYFKKAAVLHSIEFIVLPLLMFLVMDQKSTRGKFIFISILILATVLTQKLTGYIIGIASILYLTALYFERITQPKWRSFIFSTLIPIAFVSTCIIMVFGFFYFREYLPTGNSEVRLHQYDRAINGFIDSPIWGQGYTAGSGEIYIEDQRILNIPTHSDLLDLLKQGGLIAFILWLLGTLKCFMIFRHNATKISKNSSFFHCLVFFELAIILTCAVNPLFLTPTYAFLIWGILGIGLGVASSENKNEK